MNNTIYLISSGSYSDYTIDHAFSSREKAELYKVAMYSDDNFCRIEEMDMDPEIDSIMLQKYNDGYSYWQVSYYKKTLGARKITPNPDNKYYYYPSPPSSLEESIRVECWAKSMADAITIHQDICHKYDQSGKELSKCPKCNTETSIISLSLEERKKC